MNAPEAKHVEKLIQALLCDIADMDDDELIHLDEVWDLMLQETGVNWRLPPEYACDLTVAELRRNLRRGMEKVANAG